jgi:hypothetical protein
METESSFWGSVANVASGVGPRLLGALDAVRERAVPVFIAVAGKIQDLWVSKLPILALFPQLAMDKIGFGLGLLGAGVAILPLWMSRNVENRVAAIALFIIGMVGTGVGIAMLAAATKVIPLPIGYSNFSYCSFL